jgi:protease I
MKRFTILIIILVGFTAVCLGQRRSGVSPLRIVQLPVPRLTGPVSLEQALAKCRSVRQFAGRSLDFTQIGQLAWAGQGITGPEEGLQTTSPAGVTYPMKLYFATREGLFIYHPDEHSLEETSNQDIRENLAAAALEQEAVADAACDIIVAGSAKELTAKHTHKTARYMLMQTGHIAQNIQLQAASLGLGSAATVAFNANQVRRACRLPTNLEPVYIICVGYPAGQTAAEKGEEQTQIREADSPDAKTAVLIIASRNFRDEELLETKRELETANVDTVIASTKTGVIKGTHGAKVEAAILVNDIAVEDYDAIIFIGGPGAKEYFDSSVALSIARQAKDKEKILAAICIAPAVLANAGVLNGVRATCFSTEKYRLKKAGAVYTGADVERDGLIITADGPRSAAKFGKTVADALAGR